MEFTKIHIKSQTGYYTFNISDATFKPESRTVIVDKETRLAGYIFRLCSTNIQMYNLFKSSNFIDFMLESDYYYYKNEFSLIQGFINPERFCDYLGNEIIWRAKYYPYRFEKSKELLATLTN